MTTRINIPFLHTFLTTLILFPTLEALTLNNIIANTNNFSILYDDVDYKSLDISNPGTTNHMFDSDDNTNFDVTSYRASHSSVINIFLPDALIDHILIKSKIVNFTDYNVTLDNDAFKWVHHIRSNCNDPYRRLVNNVYYQCLKHQEDLIISFNDFYVVSNGDQKKWWTTFKNMEISYNAGMTSVLIYDVSVMGSAPQNRSCNCFLPGVVDVDQPCDNQFICLCRNGLTSKDCTLCSSTKPSMYPNYGPIRGGQLMAMFQGSCWNFVSVSEVFIGDQLCRRKPNDTLPNVYSNGTKIDASVPSCLTTTYNDTFIGMNVPVKVCWNSYCISLDNVTYQLKPNPIITTISRKNVMISGGVVVSMEGQHLNMAPNPILMVQVISSRTLFLMSSSELQEVNKRVCQVSPDETKITCYAPNMLRDLVIPTNDAYYVLYPMPGVYDTFIENLDMRFKLCKDPQVSDWKPFTKDLPRNPVSMDISADNFLACNFPTDYQVYVSNVPTTITSILTNTIWFNPPPKPQTCSKNAGSSCEVKLTFGTISLVVGSIQYDPDMTSIILAAVLGSLAGIFLLIIIGAIVYCAKTKKLCFKEKEIKREEYHNRSLLDDLEEPLRAKVQRCLVDAKHVVKQNEIGKGFFGKVYLGQYNDKPVAVKTLHGEAQYNLLKKVNFLEEAVMMMDFTHSNVLTLLAITIERNTPNVVLPFMENGDLRSYVLNENNHFVLGELLNFCLQVASGMEYLASKKFVHRDLAARNCMVDSNLTVKVADFGLARDLYQTNYYVAENRSLPLPYKWMPVECLSGKLQFSEKTDVWSYGVLMWEVFTRGSSPYFELQHKELKRFLINGGRLERPAIVPDYIYDVMLSCWNLDPQSRPVFSELKSSIEFIFSSSHVPQSNKKETGNNESKPHEDYLTLEKEGRDTIHPN